MYISLYFERCPVYGDVNSFFFMSGVFCCKEIGRKDIDTVFIGSSPSHFLYSIVRHTINGKLYLNLEARYRRGGGLPVD